MLYRMLAYWNPIHKLNLCSHLCSSMWHSPMIPTSCMYAFRHVRHFRDLFGREHRTAVFLHSVACGKWTDTFSAFISRLFKFPQTSTSSPKSFRRPLINTASGTSATDTKHGHCFMLRGLNICQSPVRVVPVVHCGRKLKLDH